MKRLHTFILFLLPFLLSISPAEAKKYRILSCDGGGIRGVISAQIILMLEEEHHFLKNVDLYAGTSTGSIIAGFLAGGKNPKELVSLYTEHGQEIFEPAHPHDPLSIHSKYSNEKLIELFKTISFPKNTKNPTLSDLQKKVVIPAVKLNDATLGSWVPVFLDNFSKNPLPLVDAMLRSSAAPTYFPSYQGYIDGGVVVNNPSLLAICTALDPTKGNREIKEIHLLSIGTGLPKDAIVANEDLDWGIAEWLVYNPFSMNTSSPSHPIIDVMQDTSVELTDELSAQILGKRYLRISPELQEAITLDDWQDAAKIVEEVKQWPKTRPVYWKTLSKWVKENFVD